MRKIKLLKRESLKTGILILLFAFPVIFLPLISLCGCGGNAPVVPSQAEEEAAVTARLNEFAAAFADEDYAALRSMISPNVKTFSETWREQFDNYVFYSVSLSDLEIKYSGNSAIVTGTEVQEYDTSPSSTPPKKHTKLQMKEWALEKIDGVWMIRSYITGHGCQIYTNLFVDAGKSLTIQGKSFYASRNVAVNNTQSAHAVDSSGNTKDLGISTSREIYDDMTAPSTPGGTTLTVTITGRFSGDVEKTYVLEHSYIVIQ